MPQRLSTYLKNRYGEKVYRLSLSSGCGCPNRDGSICYDAKKDIYYFGEPKEGDIRLCGGCTFCSEGGSGEFSAGNKKLLTNERIAGRIAEATESFCEKDIDINRQIELAKKVICAKTDAKKFIAYFQSYTNTYGDPKRLKELYLEAINHDEIVALSIGTRPDCLSDEIMDMLKELNQIKPVWIELGLQTIHEETARKINRGYGLSTFENAYKRLKEAGIEVIVHVILGLPGESKDDMLSTVNYLSKLSPTLDGIKLQNLQILKGTKMYEEYLESKDYSENTGINKSFCMSMEEYTDLVAECLALLPKDTVVHRMTGDGPRSILVEPLWSLDKKRVLNLLNKKCDRYFQ